MTGSRFLAFGLLAACLAAHAADGLDLKTPVAAQRCDIARDGDFAGDGRHRLEAYLESLVRASGDRYGIRPQEFQLLVSSASPPIVGGRRSEGDIGCSWGRRYISLYKRALTNRPLAETYNTIAYQYFRHIQVKRDGVSCDLPFDGVMELQAEARDWAQKIAPLCR
jgi:hypothetical protein